MPDDHSMVEPLLPIPNRTVKRLCADDSEQLACESRLLSGFYAKPQIERSGVFSFGDRYGACRSSRRGIAIPAFIRQRCGVPVVGRPGHVAHH